MPARKKKEKIYPFGFTLVEVITVLVVIAGLIILSYLNIPSIQAKVRDARRKADLHEMALAIADFEDANNCYPISLPVCRNALEDGTEVILSDIPCDPKDDFISYIYVTENAECPSWFQLYTNLEDEDDVIIEKVGCTYGCGPDCQFNYGVASPNQNLNPYCGPEAPPVDPAEYVCDPAGSCEVYSDPEISGCPDIYPDDPTCQDQCEPRINRCHDERGKFLH